MKRFLTLAVLALALPSAAAAAQRTPNLVVPGSTVKVPFSDAASTGPAVIAGPVFATVVQPNLPCFSCVVPPPATTATAFSFGTSAPVATITKAQTTSQYVVYVQNNSCAAPQSGNNITVTFTLTQAGKVLDSGSASGVLPVNTITFASFNRNRPAAVKADGAKLTGTITCLTQKASMSASQYLFFTAT